MVKAVDKSDIKRRFLRLVTIVDSEESEVLQRVRKKLVETLFAEETSEFERLAVVLNNCLNEINLFRALAKEAQTPEKINELITKIAKQLDAAKKYQDSIFEDFITAEVDLRTEVIFKVIDEKMDDILEMAKGGEPPFYISAANKARWAQYVSRAADCVISADARFGDESILRRGSRTRYINEYNEKLKAELKIFKEQLKREAKAELERRVGVYTSELSKAAERMKKNLLNLSRGVNSMVAEVATEHVIEDAQQKLRFLEDGLVMAKRQLQEYKKTWVYYLLNILTFSLHGRIKEKQLQEMESLLGEVAAMELSIKPEEEYEPEVRMFGNEEEGYVRFVDYASSAPKRNLKTLYGLEAFKSDMGSLAKKIGKFGIKLSHIRPEIDRKKERKPKKD